MGVRGILTGRLRSVTIKTLGDIVIWAGAIAGALFAIGMFLRAVLLKPMKASLSVETDGIKSSLDKVELRLGGVEQRISDHIVTHGNLSRDSSAR
jgi:hypothetical protein